MDKLLAKLSEQPSAAEQSEVSEPGGQLQSVEHLSSPSSLSVNIGTDTLMPTAPTTRSVSTAPHDSKTPEEEVQRLKLELAQAKSKIDLLDHELVKTRLASQSNEHIKTTLGTDADLSMSIHSPTPTRATSQLFTSGPKASMARDTPWSQNDDYHSDTSEFVSAVGAGRGRGIWAQKQVGPVGYTGLAPMEGYPPGPWPNSSRYQGYNSSGHTSPAPDGLRSDRFAPDNDALRATVNRRGGRFDNRNDSHAFSNSFTGFGTGPGHYESSLGYGNTGVGSMPVGPSVGMYSQYGQQAIRPPLSPHATEFTSTAGPWKSDVSNP